MKRMAVEEDSSPAQTDNSGRDCVIFDLDGTFAFLGDRSPYDASKAEGDEVNEAVHFVYAAIRAGKPKTAIFWFPDVRNAGAPKRSAGSPATASPTTGSICGAPGTGARTPSSNARFTSATSPAATPCASSSKTATRSCASGGTI
jgi:hypothetical protein